jgi:carbamoyltransferase
MEIEQRLTEMGARFSVINDDSVAELTACALARQEVVGWFQGRMEFGPRALGARSILADPRSPLMQRDLNLKIKFRESFRPFAPAVLREDASDWFELETDSPYMLFTAAVRNDRRRIVSYDDQIATGFEKLSIVRSDLPAITHVDYSARLQTVNENINPAFRRLLERFKQKTGCPVLINTSFNVRGEPIVCTPDDAFRCFMGNGLDLLVIGNCILRKQEQDPTLKHDASVAFDPD